MTTPGDLERLTETARRGTARLPLPEVSDSTLGAALSQISRDTPEAALLARAALVGLYHSAGRAPAHATAPAPVFEPSGGAFHYASAGVLALLPALLGRPPVLRELLQRLAERGLNLPVTDALPLLESSGTQGGDPLGGTLWPVLDELGQWLARLHPVWKRCDPEQPSESVQLERLRRELTLAHASDPAATAADLLTRWNGLKADERRAALDAVASSLHPADLPLLHLAQQDRLDDVRRTARLLPAHLPGELADRTRAALQALVKLDKKGKLKLGVTEIPAELRDPNLKKGVLEDDLALLIGATPIEVTVQLLASDKQNVLEQLLAYRSPASPQNLPQSLLGDLQRAAFGGASLNTLTEFGHSRSWILNSWPQQRVRGRLWEAIELLLQQKQPEDELVYVTASLMNAMTTPLLKTASDAAPAPSGRPGLLQRLKSLVTVAGTAGTSADTQGDAGKLSALAALLLKTLALDQPEQQHLFLNLLSALVLQLDPFATLPELAPQPPTPELDPAKKPSKEALQTAQRREWQRRQLEQHHAELTHILDLRRQIHTLLANSPQSEASQGADS